MQFITKIIKRFKQNGVIVVVVVVIVIIVVFGKGEVRKLEQTLNQ